MYSNQKNVKECCYPLDQLVNLVAELRGDKGCPWDKEQTHHSIKKCLIEETYEVIEAIDKCDMDELQKELGDLLLQVVFHSQLAAEKKYFDINDVISTVTEKIIRRHPHVFGDVRVKNSKEAIESWEKIKEQERDKEEDSLLSNIPKGLPALMKALKLQSKASKVGFDWQDYKGAQDKLNEELKELYNAIENGNNNEIIAELGDVLFALVNVARLLNVDAEEALSLANERFKERFQYIERKVESKGKSLADTSLEEMNYLWEEAKKHLKIKSFEKKS